MWAHLKLTPFSIRIVRHQSSIANTNFVFILHFISFTYIWDILQFDLKKSLDLGLKKQLNHLSGIRLTLMYWGWTWKALWVWIPFMIVIRLEKTWNYLTELGLILLYIGLRLIKLINQTGILLQKYEDFLKLAF